MNLTASAIAPRNRAVLADTGVAATFGRRGICQAFAPAMAAGGWGRIVNIASAHGLVASPFKTAYVSAKHGVLGLTKTVLPDPSSTAAPQPQSPGAFHHGDVGYAAPFIHPVQPGGDVAEDLPITLGHTAARRIDRAWRHLALHQRLDLADRVHRLALAGRRGQAADMRRGDHVGQARQFGRRHLVRRAADIHRGTGDAVLGEGRREGRLVDQQGGCLEDLTVSRNDVALPEQDDVTARATADIAASIAVLQPARPLPVTFLGGLGPAFAARLPHLDHRAALGTALDGALLLARQAA